MLVMEIPADRTGVAILRSALSCAQATPAPITKVNAARIHMAGDMVTEVSPLLQAAGISKSFAGVHALQGVSFDLRAGEIHALIGENGAGKSTLIKIITGAQQADEGTLEVGGR